MQLLRRAAPSFLLCSSLLASVACGADLDRRRASVRHSHPGSVTFIRPRCVQRASCVIGQVVAAETSTPLERAAVFLEREGPESLVIMRLTDDQGVFTVVDAPAGNYRVAVYKDARRIEARGLELGAPGTMVVPIRISD